ncbi:SDR family NAD(P)-dependent oxidoreductase [Virgibacillus salinus]|uniref:Nucleoside-diphosphate-sugar epimerase n=1 Tax=Virgibacillus salinus TaxID=553311 RepID=A0A1H1FT07_9BACI|nr:SDR family NAD(P)-dependent oxidoreductase [Virgibacillus salinus]SDR04087.1 Nucleoside-diphosphate-sugar epimerase [Virgibacillus salinus]
MKVALVLGATGGMGYSIVRELSARNIKVKAFARTKGKLENMFHTDPNVTIHPGDILNQTELIAAAEKVDVIFNAVNIPYDEWEDKLHLLTNNVLETARQVKSKLAVVDNIYAYGKNTGVKVNESTPKYPHTKKGKLRMEMGELIKESEIPYLIVHFPDFYGPYVENGQINYTLRQMVADKKAGFIGRHNIAREHIYTPDGAKAMVELSMHEAAYGQHWNIPAADVITGEEIIDIAKSITGYSKRVFTITKTLIRFLGVFNKQMREFAEMQYLNEDPVVLDGRKYEENIGSIPKTPFHEGLKESIASYQR